MGPEEFYELALGAYLFKEDSMLEGINWVTIISVMGPILLLVIEYFLPKTDKVEANSIVESIVNILKAIFVRKKV